MKVFSLVIMSITNPSMFSTRRQIVIESINVWIYDTEDMGERSQSDDEEILTTEGNSTYSKITINNVSENEIIPIEVSYQDP